MTDKTSKVLIELDYEEAEKLHIMLFRFLEKSDRKFEKQLFQKIDEYLNS